MRILNCTNCSPEFQYEDSLNVDALKTPWLRANINTAVTKKKQSVICDQKTWCLPVHLSHYCLLIKTKCHHFICFDNHQAHIFLVKSLLNCGTHMERSFVNTYKNISRVV
jgi:hypothetical protein